ncbi:hypothetical protein [Nitrosomonas mobilis]|uniref:Transmembrane protein n=1 Tax=Nitrosomonas mobilis TaxID=51642 RepID=A0A1G5SHG2_9PROT|nr:hypothetical protein [Nitrosomonas mobilis]SCZ86427.1 membrane hypothetical protein [Nitrosomonas mobilis]
MKKNIGFWTIIVPLLIVHVGIVISLILPSGDYKDALEFWGIFIPMGIVSLQIGFAVVAFLIFWLIDRIGVIIKDVTKPEPHRAKPSTYYDHRGYKRQGRSKADESWFILLIIGFFTAPFWLFGIVYVVLSILQPVLQSLVKFII